MKVLDKLVDWQIFSQRDVPTAPVELLAPSLEMVAALQAYYTLLQQERQAVVDAQDEGLEQLAQLAVFVAQFEMNLKYYETKLREAGLGKVLNTFRITIEQMQEALRQSGIEFSIPLGKPFAEIADEVEVTGWRHHDDFSEEVVAEVTEPVVRSHNRLIRSGRVVMGAPIVADVQTLIID